jgi:hypothetical protein
MIALFQSFKHSFIHLLIFHILIFNPPWHCLIFNTLFPHFSSLLPFQLNSDIQTFIQSYSILHWLACSLYWLSSSTFIQSNIHSFNQTFNQTFLFNFFSINLFLYKGQGKHSNNFPNFSNLCLLAFILFYQTLIFLIQAIQTNFSLFLD